MDRRQQKTKIAIHQAMTTLLKKKKFEALTVPGPPHYKYL